MNSDCEADTTIQSVPDVPVDSPALRRVEELNREAETRWQDKLTVEIALSRSLVSFQANKGKAVYRWYKYTEGFSAGLVEYLLNRYQISKGALLDPFAGSGTALFGAGAFGLRAEGLELLPIGQNIIATKQLIDWEIKPKDVERLASWVQEQAWKSCSLVKPISELRITRGAYSEETVLAMGRFLGASEKENSHVKSVLLFALLCILESISFTRKDGQYLRWRLSFWKATGKEDFRQRQDSNLRHSH